MSKSIKKCFYNKLTFDKMLEAHKRASINKTNKYEVLKFNIDLENNIWNNLSKLDKLDKKYVLLCWNSWINHIGHANSYNLLNNYLSKIDFYIN